MWEQLRPGADKILPKRANNFRHDDKIVSVQLESRPEKSKKIIFLYQLDVLEQSRQYFRPTAIAYIGSTIRNDKRSNRESYIFLSTASQYIAVKSNINTELYSPLACFAFLKFRTHDAPTSLGIDLDIGIVQDAGGSDSCAQAQGSSHGHNQWIGRWITEPVLSVKVGLEISLGIHKGVIGGGRKPAGAAM